ncbi:cytochrome c oxidase subunit 2A [Lentibacillus sp.]|nr:cytochrome c oxidase subunit 2A [Lentibacillus sp.]HLS07967.1 cytochrome c oxidase subunit 2A [Lentibacillus sp.]
MEDLQRKEERQAVKGKKPNLKGTLISVMFLGLFIIVSWFGVYILFMVR